MSNKRAELRRLKRTRAADEKEIVRLRKLGDAIMERRERYKEEKPALAEYAESTANAAYEAADALEAKYA